MVDPNDGELVPFEEIVSQRYAAWLAAQAAAGRAFSEEERWWLDHIAEHIGVNLAIGQEDLREGVFYTRGGVFAARRELGPEWQAMLDEMNRVLAVA